MSQSGNPSPIAKLTPMASALSLAIFALAAQAQEAVSVAASQTDAPATAATDNKRKAAEKNTLDTVVITARKIAEPVSKAPIAVTAVSADDLKDAGVVSVADIGNVAPGVIMGRDGFGVNINIRGVTTTDTTSKGVPGVAFNVDGVAISRPVTQGLSFFDVDHLEVLRGPQGTLYGKSTTGGAVNVITAKPAFREEGSATVELGNYGTHRAEAVLNIPVNSSVAVRFAANSNDRDGYLEPSDGSKARNDQHDRAARLSALFKFSPDTTLLLSGTAATASGIGYATVPSFDKLQGIAGSSARKVFANPFGGDINERYHRLMAEFNTQIGYTVLTYVGSTSTFKSNDFTSATYDPASNRNQYAWRHYTGIARENSHELRLANAVRGELNWVVGLNLSNERVQESDHNLNAPVATPTVAASTNGIDPVNTTSHDSAGVFGQATYSLNEKLSVVFGLRESTDKTDRVGTFSAGPVPTCTNALADCIGGLNNGHQKATVSTYRFGLNYQLTPDQLLFGAVATGYKPGGFNDFDPSTGGTAPYGPENLVAYELGYKGRITKDLQFNADVYYYDYKKDQISSLVNISGNFVIYTRAIPATLYGWENELTFRATDDDMLRASLSFGRSKYKQFMAGLVQNVDWSGKSLDKTPGIVLTLGYDHNWTFVSGAALKARIATRFSSSYLVSDFVGATQYTQKAFTKTDLSLTYTNKDGKYYVQGFVNNLEDKLQMTSVGGNKDFSVTTPRFYGVRIGTQF